ncbi:AI-2E family transporter [Aquibacillus koreensis]|uniref:AI-2E family transporter n=1 Tax=Aquibacillus koreensis TaxID=279446 RepID=A0A9X3WFX6_9BACI|nr:AI-2E family transporter [Aquibacillus koreensis]MCT2537651.1 AI-2E family transporter [Aquibacillus koreensis]MDC3419097.1 AI-2E family transporter [Aquibacillus koreensis]
MFNQKKMRFLYWILIGILLFLFIYLLTILFPFYRSLLSVVFRILAPFIIAGLIAYLLHPLIEKLHKYNYPRWFAIIGIYLIFFGGLGYVLYKAYPPFINQLKDLNENLPHFMDMYRQAIYEVYESTSFLPETVHDKMDEFFHDLEDMIGTLLTNIVMQVTKLMDVVIVIAVIPVLVFYMLKDFKLIQSSMWKLTPKKYREDGKELFDKIDKSLGDYIRGQLLVCFFVSLTTYGILWFIDMEYPLILAIIMGITNIIPYFGPILGAVPAVIIAFTISGKMVLYVIIAVFIVQIIEGNLLSPFIVGKSINIHPILIIFALLVGGEVGGIIGMIVAVPILSVIKVIVMHTKAFRAGR